MIQQTMLDAEFDLLMSEAMQRQARQPQGGRQGAARFSATSNLQAYGWSYGIFQFKSLSRCVACNGTSADPDAHYFLTGYSLDRFDVETTPGDAEMIQKLSCPA